MRVEANGGLDTESILSTLARHEIEGLTSTDLASGTHRRVLLIDGREVDLELKFAPWGIEITCGNDHADPDSLASRIRDWFDLETDIAKVDQALARHELLRDQVIARPGIRLTGYPDPWEAAVMIVLGQQISLSAARTIGGRFVAALSEDRPGLRGFPRPDLVAMKSAEDIQATLRVTGARARTVKAVARLFAEDQQAGVESLSALPGIGPWTTACFLIRGVKEPDVFPTGDAVLKRVLGGMDVRETELLAAEWRPVRSYAAVRLWTEATAGP